MVDGFAVLTVILLSILHSLFNIITICVILLDKKLRRLPSNYPIASFLVGSALQGMVAAPVYIYKKMIQSENVTSFLCDLTRVSYFICGHTMKMSLLIISFDRMLAIKYPYKYEKYVARRNMLFVLISLWLITISIDMIPFSGERPTWEECYYVPYKAWGLSVIILYNIIPFCLMAINYISIWLVAVKFALSDKRRADSIQSNQLNIIHSRLQTNKNCRFNGHKSLAEKESSFSNTSIKSNLKFALEMKATKTSLLLLGVYVICWGPLGLFYMIDHFCSSCLSKGKTLDKVRMGIKLLCFTSSIFAPMIYCWANSTYRRAARTCFQYFGLEFVANNPKTDVLIADRSNVQ